MDCERWCDRNRLRATFLAVGLLPAAGCESSHFGVGSSNGSGMGGSGPGIAFDPGDAGFPGDVGQLGATQSWTGYVESYHCVSGSDALTLSFAVGPDGVVAGTLTLGAGSPPPPAMDPNVGYPPGVQSTLPNYVLEGFPYTIARGTLTGSRLQFAIWTREVWAGWCALQVPIPHTGSCFAGGSYQENADGTCDLVAPDGQRSQVDCGKLNICASDVCTCNETSCVVSFTSGKIDFDISLMSAMASGSVAGIGGDILNVRLTRSP